MQVNVVEFSSTAKHMLKSEYLKFRDRLLPNISFISLAPVTSASGLLSYSSYGRSFS